MSNLLDKPEWWRKRAEEARAIANSMRNAEGKYMMLGRRRHLGGVMGVLENSPRVR